MAKSNIESEFTSLVIANIKRIRIAKGITQEKLGELSGIRATNMNKLENHASG